jgi:hypothetical protein
MTDYFLNIPMKMQLTPTNTQSILPIDSLSASPTSPIVVVVNRMNGPTIARPVLTMSAFSIWLKRSITKAASISILPDKRRSIAMVNTILLINQLFSFLLMRISPLSINSMRQHLGLGILGTMLIPDAYDVGEIHQIIARR